LLALLILAIFPRCPDIAGATKQGTGMASSEKFNADPGAALTWKDTTRRIPNRLCARQVRINRRDQAKKINQIIPNTIMSAIRLKPST
jgi:hypothetical protein